MNTTSTQNQSLLLFMAAKLIRMEASLKSVELRLLHIDSEEQDEATRAITKTMAAGETRRRIEENDLGAVH